MDVSSRMLADDDKQRNTSILRMAVEIVAAYAGNNPLPTNEVPELVNVVYRSLISISEDSKNGHQNKLKPAVAVRRSITPDHLVCLEDGKKLKMLKRHLRTVYDLSPEEYREKWGLATDYPMVAPNYAKQRSNFAKQIGLGRKKGDGSQKSEKN